MKKAALSLLAALSVAAPGLAQEISPEPERAAQPVPPPPPLPESEPAPGPRPPPGRPPALVSASSKTQLRVGGGVGFVGGLMFPEQQQTIPTLGGTVSLEIDHSFGPTSLHLSPMLLFGAVTYEEARVLLGLALNVELRFNFTTRLSSGLGIFIGAGLVPVRQAFSRFQLWVGPTLTPIAVELARDHLLSLWVVLPLNIPYPFGPTAILPSIRYSYYF